MSNGQTWAARYAEREEVVVDFSFAPNGTGIPVLTSNAMGYVKSVVRTAAGKFLITFGHRWLSCLGFHPSLSVATGGTPSVAQPNEVVANLAGGATAKLTLLVESAGVLTPTDIALDANSIVYVSIRFKNTGLS